MTYAHRIDANQNEIVAAFERLGCSVIDLFGGKTQTRILA